MGYHQVYEISQKSVAPKQQKFPILGGFGTPIFAGKNIKLLNPPWSLYSKSTGFAQVVVDW